MTASLKGPVNMATSYFRDRKSRFFLGPQKTSVLEGEIHPAISRKSRLVKYYSIWAYR